MKYIFFRHPGFIFPLFFALTAWAIGCSLGDNNDNNGSNEYEATEASEITVSGRVQFPETLEQQASVKGSVDFNQYTIDINGLKTSINPDGTFTIAVPKELQYDILVQFSGSEEAILQATAIEGQETGFQVTVLTTAQTLAYIAYREQAGREEVTYETFSSFLSTSEKAILTLAALIQTALQAQSDLSASSFVLAEIPALKQQQELVILEVSKVESKLVTICHLPPGNKKKSRTITIAESALKAHLDHGDTEGACPIPSTSSPGTPLVPSSTASARPTVTFTDPALGATEVAVNKKIAITFSESMDPATITNADFLVTGPGITPVPGTVTYVGLVALFTPTRSLSPSTNYTCAMTTRVQDLAGNALAARFTWGFKTCAELDTKAPTVFFTDPGNHAKGVAINKNIAATFSEGMAPGTITSENFSVKGADGALLSGTVTYVGLVARFTPARDLAADTMYICTITTGARDLADNALTEDFTWRFTTSVAPDTSAPTVSFTDPANGETGVAFNKKIAATFSEGMDPETITSVFFSVLTPDGMSVPGTVAYVGHAARFTPVNHLAGSTKYTCAMTIGARDLAGNALVENFFWNFTTGAARDKTPPTVRFTNPLGGSTDVPVDKKIAVTFSEVMDPVTLTNTTFTVTGVPGTVTYDAVTRIATFNPTAHLLPNTICTASISDVAADLAGNPLASKYTFHFTTGSRVSALPVSLGTAAIFGAYGGGAGVTNQGISTIVNGDISTTGASTLITGFHDSGGEIFSETPLNQGKVNGTVYSATTPTGSNPGVIATACGLDARTAYDNLAPTILPGGIDVSIYGGDPGELGTRTLPPGIYKSAPGSFQITGGDLTLDAQGDPNAVWVFQMASSLTVGGPGAAAPQSIILMNGALARNVYWQVGSFATINSAGGGTMVGTILAADGVTFSTAGNTTITTLYGRALGLNAAVTLVNTVIHIPAP